MVFIDKSEEHADYDCERDGKTGRQRALDAMLDVAQQINVCPACAASGALYLAATAWIDSLGRDHESFIDLVERIWTSTQCQVRINHN